MAPLSNRFSRFALPVLAAAVLLAIPVVATTAVVHRADHAAVSIAASDDVVGNGLNITEPVRTIQTGNSTAVNHSDVQGTTVATDWVYTLTKRPTPGQ